MWIGTKFKLEYLELKCKKLKEKHSEYKEEIKAIYSYAKNEVALGETESIEVEIALNKLEDLEVKIKTINSGKVNA